jgi:hypothetical protein
VFDKVLIAAWFARRLDDDGPLDDGDALVSSSASVVGIVELAQKVDGLLVCDLHGRLSLVPLNGSREHPATQSRIGQVFVSLPSCFFV